MGLRRQGVSVGILTDSRGYVLISRRTKAQTYSGFYEFPGGKVEAGENPVSALARELWEEIGVSDPVVSPLIRLDHDYPQNPVRLFVYRVGLWKGKPRANLGQTLRWSRLESVSHLRLLEASRKITFALRLPKTISVIPEEILGQAPQLAAERLRHGFESGTFDAAMVRIRADQGQKKDWLCAVASECPGRTLLANVGADLCAVPSGYSGLHLPESVMSGLAEKPVVDGWVGASVHSRAAALKARNLGLDYVLVGNVRATPSHPGQAGIRWRGFESIAMAARLPAFAIGGLSPSDFDLARKHWAQGVAGIRGFWDR